MLITAAVLFFLAFIPFSLYFANLRLYQKPGSKANGSVSVLIPARNEELSIRAAVEAALASEGVELEVIVLDDHSEDATASVVSEIAASDARARLVTAPPLPEGWCGKQHACWQLSQQAQYPVMVFVDADVRLHPEGLAEMLGFLEESQASLISGVPQQETGSLLEKLLIPLIHFILLGFLPLQRMRQSSHSSYAAGCGQLFMARREDYQKAGGHEAIRSSLHDGITLPRAFRKSGLMTDLFDATSTAACRMYRSAGEVWHGLSKNSTEGLGSPGMILPSTLLLLGGQVLPLLLLPVAISRGSEWYLIALLSTAVVFAYLPRLAGIVRFRQSILGAILHPLGISLLVLIQWYGLLRSLFGTSAVWKGRFYGCL